jgi:hypothetical protein
MPLSTILQCFGRGKLFVDIIQALGGRRSHDRMVVGFTTTYAISAYHH